MRSNTIRDLLARPDAARPSLLQRRIGLLLSSCFLVAFMSLCASPTPFAGITEAPANTLSLTINIRFQYTVRDAPASVYMSITFAKDGGAVAALDGNLSIACNGIKASRAGFHVNMTMAVLRQPAGDTYQCFYTDEHGTKTPLFIPIPAGALAITSPAAGDTVHVTDTPLLPPGVTPTPTPAGSPPQHPTAALPQRSRPPSSPLPPLYPEQ